MSARKKLSPALRKLPSEIHDFQRKALRDFLDNCKSSMDLVGTQASLHVVYALASAYWYDAHDIEASDKTIADACSSVVCGLITHMQGESKAVRSRFFNELADKAGFIVNGLSRAIHDAKDSDVLGAYQTLSVLDSVTHSIRRNKGLHPHTTYDYYHRTALGMLKASLFLIKEGERMRVAYEKNKNGSYYKFVAKRNEKAIRDALEKLQKEINTQYVMNQLE